MVPGLPGGEATYLPRCYRQALEHILSLAYQKLRGIHQKLPMDKLVLEDEKHHGVPSTTLQKVKVSVRRTQPLCSGDGFAPPSVVSKQAPKHPLGACQQCRILTPPHT